MTQDTAESRILKARVRLLLSQPFFGNLLLYLEPVERKGMAMPTVSTDGDHLSTTRNLSWVCPWNI